LFWAYGTPEMGLAKLVPQGENRSHLNPEKFQWWDLLSFH
jgi:hypothetical protein